MTLEIHKSKLTVIACSECKSVRMVSMDFWVNEENRERYLSGLESLYEVELSHGLCPDCGMRTRYGLDQELPFKPKNE